MQGLILVTLMFAGCGHVSVLSDKLDGFAVGPYF